jgi:NADH pyrophosphatase NudC (nudix superfamily)
MNLPKGSIRLLEKCKSPYLPRQGLANMPRRKATNIIEAHMRKQKLPKFGKGHEFKRSKSFCPYCKGKTITEVLSGEVRCQDCRSIWWPHVED